MSPRRVKNAIKNLMEKKSFGAGEKCDSFSIYFHSFPRSRQQTQFSERMRRSLFISEEFSRFWYELLPRIGKYETEILHPVASFYFSIICSIIVQCCILRLMAIATLNWKKTPLIRLLDLWRSAKVEAWRMRKIFCYLFSLFSLRGRLPVLCPPNNRPHLLTEPLS